MIKKVMCLVTIVATVLVGCSGNSSTRENEDKNNVESIISKATEETIKNISDVAVGEVTEDILRNYEVADVGDFLYEFIDDGVKITKYVGDSVLVVIPDSIEGKNVIKLSVTLFGNDCNVRGVYAPDTVKELDSTFTNNASIEVVICEGLQNAKEYTFANCANLHTILLGEELEKIGDFAFSGCPSLHQVVIPPSLKEIDEEYSGCLFKSSPNLTIIGESGSLIESYCKEHGINFQTK